MQDLLIWSLKSSAILVVLFTCYYFLFRSNTAFRLRRALLLGILGLSCLAPAFEIQVSEQNPFLIQKAVELKSIAMFEVNPINYSSYHSNPTPIPEQKANSIDWKSWALKAYGIGILLSLALLLFELGKVFYLRASSKRDHTMGRLVFRHSRISSPFSFFRWIFIPQDAQYESGTWKIIDTHEQTHVQKRHSIDLLLSRVAQSIMWFNPIIYLLQRELRSVHEAQADESVLQNTTLNTYAQTLMQVSLPGYQLPIGHSFAVISSFSKRLKLMKTHKTRLRTTILSLAILFTLSAGFISWSSLKGQDSPVRKKVSSDSSQRYSVFEDQLKMMNLRAKEEGYPEVSSREEALEIEKKNISQLRSSFYYIDKVPSRLKERLEKLKEIYPSKDILVQYITEPSSIDYQGTYFDNSAPLYIGQLTYDDKEELANISLRDTARTKSMVHVSKTYPVHFFNAYDYLEEYIASIHAQANYIMFYEVAKERDSEIYDENEVDIKPEPVGGVEAFERAIALDIKVPENLSKADLPESIEFSAVIYGGRQIGNVNLLTELKGSDKKNKEAYLFFGQIIQEIQDKTRQFYTWKRGMKDNQQVKVRVKISIPTKYMM
ncbi:MAG: hypothetical protein HWE07_06550 [Cytophagia bacterium]|nr:hypothetical protein [Cytophagia bacterium]